jgi:hypothetical protein
MPAPTNDADCCQFGDGLMFEMLSMRSDLAGLIRFEGIQTPYAVPYGRSEIHARHSITSPAIAGTPSRKSVSNTRSDLRLVNFGHPGRQASTTLLSWEHARSASMVVVTLVATDAISGMHEPPVTGIRLGLLALEMRQPEPTGHRHFP